MGKGIRNINYRVVISPRNPEWFDLDRLNDAEVERFYRQECESIVEQIKRHVDDVGYIEVKHDLQATCEYCGSNWTSVDHAYNRCCKSDLEEYERADLVWKESV